MLIFQLKQHLNGALGVLFVYMKNPSELSEVIKAIRKRKFVVAKTCRRYLITVSNVFMELFFLNLIYCR